MVKKIVVDMIDLNDLLLDFQNILIENNYSSMSAWINNDKWGFSKNYRNPIKRAYSKDELYPISFYPFIGVDMFLDILLIYVKTSQSDLFNSCVSEIHAEDKEINRYLELGKNKDWRNYLDGLVDLGSSVKITIDNLLRRALGKFSCNPTILSEDLIGYDASREMVVFYSFGSVYKLHFLSKSGYELEVMNE